MEKTVAILLKGLDCPHCAAQIETESKKIKNLKNVTVNLLKQEMTAQFTGGEKEMLNEIQAVVHKYEPNVKVFLKKNMSANGQAQACAKKHSSTASGCDCAHDNRDTNEEQEESFALALKKKLAFYTIGIFVFIAATLVKKQQPAASDTLYLLSYAIFGWDVVLTALKNIARGRVFDENFLMSVSTIGAIIIGELPEAVFVMFFYQVGELFQSIAVGRSRRSIRDLMNIKPDFANVEREGQIRRVAPQEVAVGESIVIKPGEKIPLDGIVLSEGGQIDTMALTGESVPRSVSQAEEVLSGCININNVLRVRVSKPFGESTVVKILELVENASSKKSKTEQFITKFAAVYTPIVVFAALALALVVPLITGGNYAMWINRALIFLVVSCPCALVLSVPLGFFAGIGEASAKGILVKGSNYITALTKVNTVVLDKTGTLTKGVFAVQEVEVEQGFEQASVLKYTAMAERMSTHPIAKSIVRYYEEKEALLEAPLEVQLEGNRGQYEETSGYGVKYSLDDVVVLAGNRRLLEREGIACKERFGIGSKVYVAINGVFAGVIVVADSIKEDSRQAIKKLKEAGIHKVIMLTGDVEQTAKAVAEELDLDGYYAQLLPQDKVERLEEIMKQTGEGRVLFAGDGINDAPVLALADVGVAMGGVGSDAAIEAADVVIMNDEVSKIADGVLLAHATTKIVNQNITFALGVKAIVLVFGAFGYTTMWAAVFADVGVAVLTVLNAMRKKLPQ